MKRTEEDFKKLYESLIETDELKTVYKGNWEADKTLFIKRQKELEELTGIEDWYFDGEE